jgi:hypothetical protein
MVVSASGAVASLALVGFAGLVMMAAAGGESVDPAAVASHRAEVEAWQQKRDASLRADESWLTLAGLIWLKEGPNTVGSDPASDIVLPPGSGPARAMVLTFREGRTRLKAAPGVALTINNQPAQEADLKSDESGPADVVRLGQRIAFLVIKRGSRYAVRLKDNDTKAHREFKGIERFPIQWNYRVVARWAPYEKQRMVEVPNVLGEIEYHASPGYAVFNLHGKEQKLVPYFESPGDQKLFYVFKDLTSGKETYGACRFLYSELPQSGQVVLDFNKSYNPPCAFTPYATCPLPMKENVLQVRIEAGEKFQRH